MALWRAAVFAALFFATLAGPMPGRAQDVTLKSRDGAISIEGTLLGFDGEFYRVETRFGEITVDGSGVTCRGPGCPSLTDYVARVKISGSATIGRVLMPALIESFAERNGLRTSRTRVDATRVDYTLRDAGSGRIVGVFRLHITSTDEGFADLLADEADIVMALREIRPEEADRAEEAGLGDLTRVNRSIVLALDALVPVVAPENPVTALSTADLARVLSGEVRNWQAFGGPDAPITLHLRDPRSGLAQAIDDRLLGPARVGLTAEAQRHMSNVALAHTVEHDPFGLGLASFADTGNTRVLPLTGPCGFSLGAGRRSIKSEDYPLTTPMFLYIPARRLPALARAFLRDTRGPAAQITIRDAGFVDQAPEEIAIGLQGDRLANAIRVARGDEGLATLQELTATMAQAPRLTTSFRFQPGASRLDAQSRANVRQLAEALESGVYDGRTLVFVGFSDGQGPAVPNLRISRTRAEAVLEAVRQAAKTVDPARVTLETAAFGEAMPMACDDSAWGRQVNRRVEVWVR